ncbi:Vacuolar membrane-associated protein Iml1 [Phytophthora cactorum]|nr:Vacuolar membrane-associated protein Iml1 [Phytophthora cactorum]
MWRTRRNTLDREALSLVVHGPEFRNGELLVLNPDFFPDVQILDLVEVSQPERAHPRLVLSVESLAPVRGKLQVSVAKEIAAQFGLEAFRPVTVRRVDQRDVSVDFVELSFKDQFLSRADIWRFKVTMLGQCLYVGRTVECLGIRSQVDAILANNTQLNCGVIGDATKIVVRSRSSRLFWLVQMTKWSESSVSHSVTIIAFSRSFYDANQFPDGFDPRKAPFSDPRRQGFGPGCGAPGINMANGYGPTIHVDPVSGRYYEDFYKVVVMNFTGPDWNRLLLLLKKEFASYYETHRWRTPEEFSPAQYEICRCPKPVSGVTKEEKSGAAQLRPMWTTVNAKIFPSRAKDGNILEAINVTLNVLDKHYMDRDLSRTGQGIVMMTAGCSIFNVNSKLAEITEQRMMDNGVGMDMISLSTPPLHAVPLFIYSDSPSTKTGTAPVNVETPSFLRKFSFSRIVLPRGLKLGVNLSAKESEWADTSREKLTYDVPHWVNITFLDFGCGCGRSSNIFNQAEPFSPSIHSPSAPRGWHSCECQVKRNQHFNPLPAFRMFDVTSPSDKLVFPVTLRNLMRRDAESASSFGFSAIPDEEISNNDSETGEIAGSQNRLLFETSELPDLASSAPPPEQLQLSRSPDFDPIVASGQLRSATSLSASLHARAALEEYDESVFAPVVRNGEASSRNPRDRRLRFVPLESHDEHDGATALQLLAMAISKAERTRERSNSGNYRKESPFLRSESTSMIQTLELRQGYTEAFYTLTIPTTATQSPTIECVPHYRNHDELLIEMICQRLARDFQLVSSCDSTASLMGSDSSPENRRSQEIRTREPHDPEVAFTSYNYSLWVGLTQSFQPHQQIFHRYPQPEDNWNALDNLLCGYLDDMADTMKCRRIRFAIVPPVITKDGNDESPATTYAAKFTKFIEYLQSRVAPSEFAPKASKTPHLGGNRMLSFKMACKASTLSVSSSSVSKFEDSRTEWAMMRLEETMDISRCFHLDVRWLACSGIAADEFVGTVRRRAKQAGLDLRRVPEYSSVSRVQIHPLLASVFLPLPVRISESFVTVLTQTLDFVLDDERIADGTLANKPRARMRGHRRSPSATARMLLERWQQRGYKQFIHRRVPVFVRIIHDGLIWIPGYDYDRKGDGAAGVVATEALFQQVCNAIESQCGENPGDNVSL